MYAFVSHASACEALRSITGEESRWPSKARLLPLMGECVGRQTAFRQLANTIDLSTVGICTQPVDILVPHAGARTRGKAARLHVWGRPVPADSMFRVRKNLLISGPELVIIQLCGTQSKLESLLDEFAQAVWAQRDMNALLGLNEHVVVENPLEWEKTRRLLGAMVVACEFAGTYRLPNAKHEKTQYKAPRLMTVDGLAKVAKEVGVWSPEARAANVAALAYNNSASPMETALALLLTLPLDYGGFGLPRPELNASPELSSASADLLDRNAIYCDMLWENKRVALEYDSFEFHGYSDKSQLTNDALRANILNSMGYATFRVTFGTIRSLPRLEMLAHQIAAALGVELERPNAIQTSRRTKLYTELMPRSGEAF